MPKKALIYLHFLFINQLFSQNFEWSQSYGSSKNYDGLSGITNPNDSTCTFLLNTSINSLKNVSDTLKINLLKNLCSTFWKGKWNLYYLFK